MGDILAALDRIAPFSNAEEWDNVGLIAGRLDWPGRRVLLTIDVTDAVAREALESGAELIVAYHPPIFKGIRTITPTAESPTTLLPDLLAERVSIIALHTALDVAEGGTNDVLLDAFDLRERTPLTPVVRESQAYKLVVFVPAAEVSELRAALSRAGAGVIGHYHECSFELHGRGSFIGDETTDPTIGSRGRLEFVDESRLETVVPKARAGQVVRALYAKHSYEEPAFDLYPLSELPGRAALGLGRIGLLRKPQTGRDLIASLATLVDLSIATVIGNLERTFESLIAAAGSFAARHFRDPAALVLTGELKHHDALDLDRRGVTAICLGHDASERPVLKMLERRLRELAPGVEVTISAADRSPFSPLGTISRSKA